MHGARKCGAACSKAAQKTCACDSWLCVPPHVKPLSRGHPGARRRQSPLQPPALAPPAPRPAPGTCSTGRQHTRPHACPGQTGNAAALLLKATQSVHDDACTHAQVLLLLLLLRVPSLTYLVERCSSVAASGRASCSPADTSRRTRCSPMNSSSLLPSSYTTCSTTRAKPAVPH